MTSELLNNYIANNVQATVQKPAANPDVRIAGSKASNQPVDLNLKPDTFEKKSDKKVSAGIIAAGLLLLGGGFIFLGKKGKLGESVQAFINKFFNSKTTETAVKSTQAATVQKTESAGSSAVKKYLPPEICPERITEDGMIINKPLEVQYNPKSVTDDVEDWARMHKNMPKETDYVCGGKHLPINQEFNEFEIKPHNYTDDTDIIMGARDYTCDFQTYKIENGAMKRTSSISECTREPYSGDCFEFQTNGACMQTGHFDDGRKYVNFTISNGEIVDTRPGREIVMLISKGTEFTQSQKDVIRIFETLGDKQFKAGVPTPLSFATITPNLRPNQYGQVSGGGELVRRTNRNALLSAISSWAKNSPEFDVDKYIEKTGDTFRTGEKIDMFARKCKN